MESHSKSKQTAKEQRGNDAGVSPDPHKRYTEPTEKAADNHAEQGEAAGRLPGQRLDQPVCRLEQHVHAHCQHHHAERAYRLGLGHFDRDVQLAHFLLGSPILDHPLYLVWHISVKYIVKSFFFVEVERTLVVVALEKGVLRDPAFLGVL